MKTTKLSFFPSLTIFLTFLTSLAVLSANAQVPSYVPTNGLVGYWPFNGNANDESVNGNDGTVNEAVLIADRFGSLNSAFSFDGINDFIQTPNQALPGSVSFSGWYKMSSFNNPYNDMFYVSHQSPSSDFYSTNIAFGYRSYQGQYGHSTYAQSPLTGYYPTDNLPSINVWHHITCVFENGSYVRMYLDGSLFYTSNSVVTNSSQASLPLLFGGTGTNSLYYYSGGLDDIGIWNRALTADEVLALYNSCNVAPQVVTGSSSPSSFANSTYTCVNNVGSTYNWTVNNGTIVNGQGTNSIEILWGTEGVGSVSVVETTTDGCVGDVLTFDVVIIPNSIEELSNAMILYPNPATTELNLQTTSDLIGTDVFVFDALGKQILKQQILSTNTIINTSSFAVGNYVVKVGGGVKKFTVEK